MPNTGGYGTWRDFTTTLAAGSGPVYLVFTGTGGFDRLADHRLVHEAGQPVFGVPSSMLSAWTSWALIALVPIAPAT